MIFLRELIACIFFVVGVYGVIELIIQGFVLWILAGSVFSYLLAYLCWPSKKKGQRDQGGHVADLLELIIELPGELFVWVLRLFGRMLGSGKGDGFDIDL